MSDAIVVKDLKRTFGTREEAGLPLTLKSACEWNDVSAVMASATIPQEVSWAFWDPMAPAKTTTLKMLGNLTPIGILHRTGFTPSNASAFKKQIVVMGQKKPAHLGSAAYRYLRVHRDLYEIPAPME